MGDWEQKNLINELTQGKELATQLQFHLNVPSASSNETREFLVQKILSSYEKALSMLNFSSSTGGAILRLSESPPSLDGSPRSEDSDRDQEHRDASRKRKTLPGWTHKVRVSPETGLEGTLDDGFSWRKYGQKDILGAKYPRGYYRCTHRNVQGCLATKQVQRADEDPNIFEITYRGRHTCTKASLVNPLPALPENQVPNNTNMEPQQQHTHQPQQNQNPPPEMLSNFREGLKVLTQDLDTTRDQAFPSFHFPSTSNVKAENPVFPAPLIDNNFVGNFSTPPSFMPSASTSGTNYFSVGSSSGMNSFGGSQHLQRSDQSELTGVVSAATSATNSPTVGLDFPFGQEFDPNFTFDNPGFFP